ncbi:RNA-directed RNA polymerase [ssRNA phage Esthiorhiza.2_1]|uniref:RNA-directed RNA polymerase n=2 Tax=Leviviricetes TaxID=2842243 RepID=A0A8S5KX85_9VIRU|nr:RNA-directed RNA polymerase [ssRNA phage Esthiorhiza.2_1]QDH87210.1 MAG: RNA-dependent RNA polymerase [Leviviridae sp.]DAD49950.1 TPA_asm: RNA-directed RNA polymerase [ssRNA phage Esthiorhiza.2_1]
MKSLMSLWSRLAEESAGRCCTSATRDINTISRRVEHEGLSFLTITLPDLGKAIQKWLDQGKVGTHPAFLTERGGSLPRFLGGFFNRVFDRSSGLLLDEPCIDSILALRQLTLMFGKMQLPCSPARQAAAIRGYFECEQDVRDFDTRLSESDLAEFRDVSEMLYGGLFERMNRDVYFSRLVPKHGPGSTSDRLSSNGKYHQLTWTVRLERVFPARSYVIPNWHFMARSENMNILEPGRELPVRVALVPKTLKAPRVIAMEPTCMQYMQQAVYRCFTSNFKRDRLLTKLIGFDDQTLNQRLAKQGSIDNRTATLDLSDASDRVSNQLVRAMVSRYPFLSTAIDSTRSRRAVVGSKTIRLAKYASMGSALCFPMEAMVFTTLIYVGIQRSLNTSLSRKDVKRLSGSVRVYGDDLIVPVDHVLSVVQTLEHFGAKVGLSKSFWNGKFRESCGKEYYDGHDVSICRVRRMLPTQRQDASGVISTVCLRNQLFMSGYWDTCRWLDKRIEGLIKFFPTVLPTSPVLGRVSSLGYTYERVHPRVHNPLVRGYVVDAKPPKDVLGGVDALTKCLLRLGDGRGDGYTNPTPWLEPGASVGGPFGIAHDATLWSLPPQSDENHLERSGRPKRVSIKLGWNSPH